MKKSCRPLLRRRPVTEVVNRQDNIMLDRPSKPDNNFLTEIFKFSPLVILS